MEWVEIVDWTDEKMRTDKWIGCKNGLTDDDWLNEWINEWMNEIDEWMNEWMNE